VFGTDPRRLGYVWSMLSGRRFRTAEIHDLVAELRATLDEVGGPEDPAEGAFGGPFGGLPAALDPAAQDLARQRFRRTVERAVRDVPYYRRWFTSNGVAPDSVTLDAPTAVAPTSSAVLRGLPAAFVADGARPALVAQTMSTAGTPSLVWFSRDELEVAAAIGALALMLVQGLRPHHVWASCASSRSLAPFVGERSTALTGAAFAHLGGIDSRAVLERLATPLHLPGKERRITHLNVGPSQLAALVQLAEGEGRRARDFGLRRICCCGGVLTDALRRRAEDVFGARVGEGYAMTEITPVGGAVCSRRHLHIPSDQGHVEVLDRDTLLPAAPGAVGMLTVTPYSSFRDTTVLLRYLTGDLVRVLPAADQEVERGREVERGGEVERGREVERGGLIEETPSVERTRSTGETRETGETRPAGEPRRDCEMAGIPASSRVLGRMTADALTTRDVLDLLQAEPDVPLPSRYTLGDGDSGTVLYVMADRTSRALLARLEERAAAMALPLAGIVLVEDPGELPAPVRLRVDLSERGFGLSTPSVSPASAAAAERVS
jgi:phenylacetate-coenzyme A ligase PaaK-like adenylate-forming protein